MYDLKHGAGSNPAARLRRLISGSILIGQMKKASNKFPRNHLQCITNLNYSWLFEIFQWFSLVSESVRFTKSEWGSVPENNTRLNRNFSICSHDYLRHFFMEKNSRLGPKSIIFMGILSSQRLIKILYVNFFLLYATISQAVSVNYIRL